MSQPTAKAYERSGFRIDDHREAGAALQRLVAKIERPEPDHAWFGSMIIKRDLLGDPTLETAPFEELRERIRGDRFCSGGVG